MASRAGGKSAGAMKGAMRKCSLLLMASVVFAESAWARSYLNCLTRKIVIVDGSSGSTSSSTEESLAFWIDEVAKSVALADGTPLLVHRFDDRWKRRSGRCAL
jgi:hypothetical protein